MIGIIQSTYILYVSKYIYIFIFMYTHVSFDTSWYWIFGLFSFQIPQYFQKVDRISIAIHAGRTPGGELLVGKGG